jgi:hypothetical protein
VYSLRHIDPNDKLFDHLDGHLFASFFSQDDFEICCAQFPSLVTRRKRCFTSYLLFLLLLMSTLWPRDSLGRIWKRLSHPFSDQHPSENIDSMTDSAISYQRARFDVGILPLFMRRMCKPICTPEGTSQAFYHGKRLVAIDGTKMKVPDTAANVDVFGCSSNQQGTGAYPQVQAVVLMECGSRAVFDVALGTHAEAEIHALPVLLERLTADMLVLSDCAFFSVWFWEQAHQRIGADLLGAIKSTVGLQVEKRLSDGSYLTTITPNRRGGIHQGTGPMQVRVIEYFITDERLGEPGQCYRLVTTLLDEHRFPASELILLYHERWEVETMLDETKTHQRQQVRVLRSLTPDGVKQEVYALFLAHYALSCLKHQAAQERGVDADRISFTETIFQVREAFGDSLRYDPSGHERIISRLLRRIALSPLPSRLLRVNRREIKQIYNKHKPKKRDVPPPAQFGPDDVFLDFVELWERPDGILPVGKTPRRQTSPGKRVQEEIPS